MVYGAVTGVLGLLYGRVPSSRAWCLVPSSTRELRHAGALAAALLFRPIRRRLHDRGSTAAFYREKLDTVATLESLTSHVRDQVDLDLLADELVTVVSDTMHPTLVSLWIHDGESAGPDVTRGSST